MRLRFLQGFEHRAGDQEVVPIDVHILIARLADREHLPRVVPLVKGGGGIDSFIALQAKQASRQHRRDRFRRLGLADTRGTFQQQRLAESERQIGRRRQTVVSQIERRA